jgi:hypothetical protein
LISVNQWNKKSAPIFLATWIRLFVGSGLEVLSKMRLLRRPKAFAQCVPSSECIFPLSYWICENEKLTCLISKRGEQEVTIHEFPKIVKN